MSRDYRYMLATSLLMTLAAAIGGLAVPLVATTQLHASSVQMGLLAAFDLAPFALLSLPAGPWLDRSRKKPFAITANIVAALVSLGIPLAASGGWLGMELLYALGFIQGVCNVIGGTALQILLLQIVGRERLLMANSQLGAWQAAVSVAGSLLAGMVATYFGAAIVLAANALIFGIAALLIFRIAQDDVPAEQLAAHLLHDIADGLRMIRDTPMLRSLVSFGALWLMLIGGFGAQFVLFSTRDLGFSAAELSWVAALSSVGASLGALAARRFAERVGVRAVMLAGFLVTAIAMGLYPSAALLGGMALAFAAGVRIVKEFGVPLYTVNYISLRQRLVPDALLGRVIGAMRGIAVSVAPVGAVFWSHVADHVGIAAAMHLMGLCGVVLWWVASRRMPQVPD